MIKIRKCRTILLQNIVCSILIFTMICASLFSTTSSSEITVVDYYLKSARGTSPNWQYLLNSTAPTSNVHNKIKHPYEFAIWRTDFQSNELNFSSGSWNFNLWLETNESATCKISLGYCYFNYNTSADFNVTNIQVFSLNQSTLKEYTFTFNDEPAFTVPAGGCFAFQLNASAANLYVDSTDMSSNVHFSAAPSTTTSPSETSITTSVIQPRTQTPEPTTTQKSSTEIISASTTTTVSSNETQTSSRATNNTSSHFSLTIHAHPKEAQYPSEPTTELNAMIQVTYFDNGVKKIRTDQTLFTLEVDKDSVANITVKSFPSNLGWVEWDNYGTGRKSGMNITVQMNSDKNVIAYFSVETSSSSSSSSSTTRTNSTNAVNAVPGFPIISILVGFLSALILIVLIRIKPNIRTMRTVMLTVYKLMGTGT